MKKHVYWMCTVMNIVVLICFTFLAVVFGKWWISLFSVLFMSTTKNGTRVICDGCGRYSQKGKDHAEGIELARAAGWIRRKAGDTWEDYCPECQAKVLLKEE